MVQLWHRAGFSARHSPSPPEPQGHFQTPWDHTVHQQTYREGYPNSQDTPSRLYAGPPTERHTPPARRGEGWLEKPLSCSGISWPTWFLRGSCCSQRSRSSLYWGWGSQSGFSSDDLPFQGRWSQPRGHHWSVGSSARYQPFMAEGGHFSSAAGKDAIQRLARACSRGSKGKSCREKVRNPTRGEGKTRRKSPRFSKTSPALLGLVPGASLHPRMSSSPFTPLYCSPSNCRILGKRGLGRTGSQHLLLPH